MKQKNRGVTLIALVITIIVLLILAGASISMLTGENGLLTKANDAKKVTEEAGAKEAVQMEVAGSFGNDGIYSTHLAKQNVLNNLKPQPTVNPPLGGEDEVNAPFEVTYKGHKVNVDINGKVSTDDVEDGVSKEAISNETSFVGYYADFENEKGERIPDGTVDGIIFADKAVGNTNGPQWANGDGVYTIPKDTPGLKKYYIKQKQVVDTRWSEEPKYVISPISSSGEDRFYVMALEDAKTNDKETNRATWYKNANGLMGDYDTYTSQEFGKGKENTKRMISRMNYPEGDGTLPDKYAEFGKGEYKYGKGIAGDVWALDTVKNKVDNGWFVPSRAEWAAFANELKISNDSSNTEYYEKHKLSDWYWSSSQYGTNFAYTAHFDLGCIRRQLCEWRYIRSFSVDFLIL